MLQRHVGHNPGKSKDDRRSATAKPTEWISELGPCLE